MFTKARLQLIFYYVVIIVIITGVFSAVVYQTSNRQLQDLIRRLRFEREHLVYQNGPRRPAGFPSLEELEELQQRSLWSLLLVDGVIILIAGGAGYLLAGKTLRPIQHMVDEQRQFITNASHELRTPLTTLQLELESSLLEKKTTVTELRQLMKSNLEEVGRLQQLAEALLQSDHVASAAPLVMKSVEVRDVVMRAVNTLLPQSKRQHISIKIDVASQKIVTDETSLYQVLTIILDNAVKYSRPNTRVFVRTKTVGHSLILTVEDEGEGIPEDQLELIFKRFYRVDAARSEVRGYGLGLSLARQLVQKLGGTIVASSKVGKGSVFTVTIPVAVSPK